MWNLRTRAWSLAADVLRMAAVIGLLSTVVGAGVYGVSGELAATVPDAGFDYEYDPSAGTLEITHDGGDALDATAVRVVFDGAGPTRATLDVWPERPG